MAATPLNDSLNQEKQQQHSISLPQSLSGCLNDPNFATICSFLENFGATCNIGFISFAHLQQMLEDTNTVASELSNIHILLLRRIYKSISTEKWEKHLAKFCHSYNSQDAWEVERFGYKKSKIQTKLRLLKNLMEAQFDFNTKFKNEVNKISAENLRKMPLGRDSEGQLYWYQVDVEANLRIYREDVDDDTWELVAQTRDEFTDLISQLESGIVHRNTYEGENGTLADDLSPKDEIIRDTGAISDGEPTSMSESGEEGMEIIEDDMEVSSMPKLVEEGPVVINEVDTAREESTASRSIINDSMPRYKEVAPDIKDEIESDTSDVDDEPHEKTVADRMKENAAPLLTKATEDTFETARSTSSLCGVSQHDMGTKFSNDNLESMCDIQIEETKGRTEKLVEVHVPIFPLESLEVRNSPSCSAITVREVIFQTGELISPSTVNSSNVKTAVSIPPETPNVKDDSISERKLDKDKQNLLTAATLISQIPSINVAQFAEILPKNTLSEESASLVLSNTPQEIEDNTVESYSTNETDPTEFILRAPLEVEPITPPREEFAQTEDIALDLSNTRKKAAAKQEIRPCLSELSVLSTIPEPLRKNIFEVASLVTMTTESIRSEIVPRVDVEISDVQVLSDSLSDGSESESAAHPVTCDTGEQLVEIERKNVSAELKACESVHPDLVSQDRPIENDNLLLSSDLLNKGTGNVEETLLESNADTVLSLEIRITPFTSVDEEPDSPQPDSASPYIPHDVQLLDSSVRVSLSEIPLAFTEAAESAGSNNTTGALPGHLIVENVVAESDLFNHTRKCMSGTSSKPSVTNSSAVHTTNPSSEVVQDELMSHAPNFSHLPKTAETYSLSLQPHLETVSSVQEILLHAESPKTPFLTSFPMEKLQNAKSSAIETFEADSDPKVSANQSECELPQGTGIVTCSNSMERKTELPGNTHFEISRTVLENSVTLRGEESYADCLDASSGSDVKEDDLHYEVSKLEAEEDKEQIQLVEENPFAMSEGAEADRSAEAGSNPAKCEEISSQNSFQLKEVFQQADQLPSPQSERQDPIDYRSILLANMEKEDVPVSNLDPRIAHERLSRESETKHLQSISNLLPTSEINNMVEMRKVAIELVESVLEKGRLLVHKDVTPVDSEVNIEAMDSTNSNEKVEQTFLSSIIESHSSSQSYNTVNSNDIAGNEPSSVIPSTDCEATLVKPHSKQVLGIYKIRTEITNSMDMDNENAPVEKSFDFEHETVVEQSTPSEDKNEDLEPLTNEIDKDLMSESLKIEITSIQPEVSEGDVIDESIVRLSNEIVSEVEHIVGSTTEEMKISKSHSQCDLSADGVTSLDFDVDSPPVTEPVIKKSTAWVTGQISKNFLIRENNPLLEISLECVGESVPKSEQEPKVILQEQIQRNEGVYESNSTELSNLQSSKLIPTVCKGGNQSVTYQSVGKLADESEIQMSAEKPVQGKYTLVGYAGSSDEDEFKESTEIKVENTNSRSVNSPIIGQKRYAESPSSEPFAKHPKVDKIESTMSVARCSNPQPSNPIVGEVVEEALMIITGEGSGADVDGGNSPGVAAIEASLGRNSSGGQSFTTNESPKKRGRPKGKKTVSQTQTSRGKRLSQDLDDSSSASATSVPGKAVIVNKKANGRLNVEIPTRQSSRIAKIQEREEQERRRIEEETLAKLKAAQVQKLQRQQEKQLKAKVHEVKIPATSPSVSPSRGKGRPRLEPKYLTTSSDTNEDSEEEVKVKKSKKPVGKRKHVELPTVLMKKGLNPWIHTSSEDDDEVVEEEEEYHEDIHEEEEDLILQSDHEFSPESDLGEDEDEIRPSRHARTVKRGEIEEDKYAETNCNKCGKGDHPEWILLCDFCDKGWHASCLRPVIWVIPEGQWFCPPCQHKMFVQKLNENLGEYDKIVKKQELEVLRKERLAYVGISLANVLPESDKKTASEGRRKDGSKRKKRRRLIVSDEDEDDLMTGGGGNDRFIDDREDSSNISVYSSNDSENEPKYKHKLRTRRGGKSFTFKEYDEMINSALKDEDEYMEETVVGAEKKQENGEVKVNDERNVPLGDEVLPVTVDDVNGDKSITIDEKEKEVSDEEIDEAEKKRRIELDKQSHRKSRRRLNDLDATSEDEDSDEDFKGSDEDEEDDEVEGMEDDDSEWSGDRDEDESDDSIAQRGKKGKYGRRDKYLEVGSVRRSTRKARSRVVYDESDQSDDEDEGEAGWGSEEESEASTGSESDDATWGKRKKKKSNFYNASSSTSKFKKSLFTLNSGSKSKSTPKRKKKKVDAEEVDRAWSKHGGRKGNEESTNKRSTRGKKIDFKVILESGESDDDGNIHPKRKKPRASDYENDSDGPSSSRKLFTELTGLQPSTSATPKKAPILKIVTKTYGRKKTNVIRSESSESEPDQLRPTTLLAEQLLKPVPAPPVPEEVKRRSLSSVIPLVVPNIPAPAMAVSPVPSPPIVTNNSTSPAAVTTQVTPPSVVGPVVSQPSTNLMMSEILASTGATKSKQSRVPSPPTSVKQHSSPPPSSPGSSSSSSSQHVISGSPGPRPISSPIPTVPTPLLFPTNPKGSTPPSRGLSSPSHQAHSILPSDMSRVPNPSFYPGQSMRFPWDPNIGPPPYPGRTPHSPIGKPPPLNSSPFSPSGSSSRSNYVPPPLRIPNLSGAGSPLQSFQGFKRDPSGPGPQMMYRIPSQGSGNGRGGPPPNILAHLQSSHERFFGPHGPFAGPPLYGLPSHGPYPTSQPQQIDYRAEETEFKDDVNTSERPSSSPSGTKEDMKSDGEFGGLVSYFSSQRGEDDMDS